MPVPAQAEPEELGGDYVEQMLALRIPARLGRIETTENNGSKRLEIIISTQTGSTETKNTINTLLEILLNQDKEKNINMICVGGAEGELRPSLAQIIDNSQIRQEVAFNLEQYGLLCPAGYARMVLRPELRVFGYQDTAEYINAIAFLAQIYNAEQDCVTALEAIDKALKLLKPQIISQASLHIIDTEERFRLKQIILEDYCLELDRLATDNEIKTDNFREFSACARLARQRSLIDTDGIKGEIESITSRLNETGKDTKKTLAQLNFFRESEKVSELEFLTILLSIAKQNGLDTDELKTLSDYRELIKDIESLDRRKIRQEAGKIMAIVKENVLSGTDERLWDGIHRATNVLTALTLLRPTEEDMDEHKEGHYCFSPLVFEKFFANHITDLPTELRPQFNDKSVFANIFDAAEKCRVFFIEHTQDNPGPAKTIAQQMDAAGSRAAIILAPPHRIKALTVHARKHRYSYMVIRPVSPLPNPANESALKSVLTDTRMLRFINPVVPCFNPYMKPDESYAPYLAYVPPQVENKVTMGQFIRFFPAPDKAISSLMLYKTYTAFVRELGPVFLYICAQDDRLNKFLDTIRSDISAGRIDTVESSNKLMSQVLSKIKKNHQNAKSLFQAMDNENDCALKISVTKTAHFNRSFYMIIEADLKGLKHEWALNISAKTSDPMNTLWRCPDDFDESQTLSVFTQAGKEDMDDRPEIPVAEPKQNAPGTQTISMAVINEFVKGVQLKQDTLRIFSQSSAGAHVIAQICNRVSNWQVSAQPRISLPELTYETEMYLLNSLPPETILDEEVETIFFNLTEVVPEINRLIEKFQKEGIPDSAQKEETIESLLLERAQTLDTEPDLQSETLDRQGLMKVSQQLFLAGNSILSSYSQIGTDLLMLGNTLQALHIVDSRGLHSRQGQAKDKLTSLFDYLAPMLSAPPITYMHKGPTKLNEKQVNDILNESGKFNPAVYFQALMAGHIEITRKFLSGLEIGTGETILEAIKKDNSDGAKILLKLFGKHTSVLDRKVNEKPKD